MRNTQETYGGELHSPAEEMRCPRRRQRSGRRACKQACARWRGGGRRRPEAQTQDQVAERGKNVKEQLVVVWEFYEKKCETKTNTLMTCEHMQRSEQRQRQRCHLQNVDTLDAFKHAIE